jgi:thiazole synthase
VKREENNMEDKLVLGGKEFSSRFILGSGKYNINLIKAAPRLLLWH